MPVGNSNIDAKDRPAIVVATPAGLELVALKVAKKQVSQITKDMKFWLFWGNFLGPNLVPSRFKATPEELFVAALEWALDLEGKVYWYDPIEATRLFRFDIGHVPQDGEIFVQHPTSPNHYILASEYSRWAAREKEAAFRRLAAALGAKEIRLVSAEVKSSSRGIKTSIPLQQIANQIGISAQFDKKNSLVKGVHSKFGKPSSSPKIPQDLESWVDADPDLKTMAYGRLEANLEYDKVTLEFYEKTGVSGEIAAKLMSKELSFGNKQEDTVHSIWHYEIEYWAKNS